MLQETQKRASKPPSPHGSLHDVFGSVVLEGSESCFCKQEWMQCCLAEHRPGAQVNRRAGGSTCGTYPSNGVLELVALLKLPMAVPLRMSGLKNSKRIHFAQIINTQQNIPYGWNLSQHFFNREGRNLSFKISEVCMVIYKLDLKTERNVESG